MRVLATTFWLAELEDPIPSLSDALAEFVKTEQGQWFNENSERPLECSDIMRDQETFAYKVAVWAWLSEQNLTYYTLKWK